MEDHPMPEAEQKESYLELFDISKKAPVATVPLANIRHMPRAGERIFLPLQQSGDWTAYTVMAVEYFLGTSQGSLDASGMVRVTLYVEQSK
jgi:hypothetical protein